MHQIVVAFFYVGEAGLADLHDGAGLELLLQHLVRGLVQHTVYLGYYLLGGEDLVALVGVTQQYHLALLLQLGVALSAGGEVRGRIRGGGEGRRSLALHVHQSELVKAVLQQLQFELLAVTHELSQGITRLLRSLIQTANGSGIVRLLGFRPAELPSLDHLVQLIYSLDDVLQHLPKLFVSYYLISLSKSYRCWFEKAVALCAILLK